MLALRLISLPLPVTAIRVLNGFWEWLTWPVLAFLVRDWGRVRVLLGNGFSAPLTDLPVSIFWWIGPKRASTRSVGLNRTGPTSAFGGRDNKCKTDTPILESGKEILETIGVVYCHLEFSCFTPLDSFLSVFVFGAEFLPRSRERH
jgi:hypothetical protein